MKPKYTRSGQGGIDYGCLCKYCPLMSIEKPPAGEAQKFYSGDRWSAEESVGYLIRQTMSATAASLARDLNTDTGAMTRMLDRLEAKGLLTRSRSVQDRRVVVLTLTDQGRELTTRIPHHLARVYNQHLTGFTQEEFLQLKGFLRRIIANRDHASE